jgi:hypothetical protein
LLGSLRLPGEEEEHRKTNGHNHGDGSSITERSQFTTTPYNNWDTTCELCPPRTPPETAQEQPPPKPGDTLELQKAKTTVRPPPEPESPPAEQNNRKEFPCEPCEKASQPQTTTDSPNPIGSSGRDALTDSKEPPCEPRKQASQSQRTMDSTRLPREAELARSPLRNLELIGEEKRNRKDNRENERNTMENQKKSIPNPQKDYGTTCEMCLPKPPKQ